MLTPVNDLILCEHSKQDEEQSTGGIVFSLRRNQKSTAKVLYVGRGVYNATLNIYDNYEIEAGDIVLFEKFRGHEVVYENVKYLALSMACILGIYKKEDLIDGKIPENIDVGDQQFAGESTPINIKPKSAFDGLI